jgi:hypothetical protein
MPFKSLDAAMRKIMDWEGKFYNDNAWMISEQQYGSWSGREVGASVCVNGRYKWLTGKELEQWQTKG